MGLPVLSLLGGPSSSASMLSVDSYRVIAGYKMRSADMNWYDMAMHGMA
jgi:hypothetical protein